MTATSQRDARLFEGLTSSSTPQVEPPWQSQSLLCFFYSVLKGICVAISTTAPLPWYPYYLAYVRNPRTSTELALAGNSTDTRLGALKES